MVKKLGWAVNGFRIFMDIIHGVVVIFNNKVHVLKISFTSSNTGGHCLYIVLTGACVTVMLRL